MALTRKAQKETDLAIRHLMDYVESNAEWTDCLKQIETDLVTPVAETLGIDYDQVMDGLFDGPYGDNVFGYVFEDAVTCDWNKKGSVIDEYLKKRGWREGPHGRKYLRALVESDVGLWEVTDVSPGEWIAVKRAYYSTTKPKRIHEKAASEQVTIGQNLAARVLTIDNKRYFSGTILPLSEPQARCVQEAVDNVSPTTKALYREMLDEKVIDEISEDVLLEDIKQGEIEALCETVFEQWAIAVIGHKAVVKPKMQNTDGEAIVLTRHRMKIIGDVEDIQKTLNQHFELTQQNEWIWLNDERKVVASIHIKGKNLELEANSVERGQRGLALLADILGSAIGTPIGVHESLEQATHPAGKASSLSQEEIQNNPEAKAQLQAYLQGHYRDSLDQPIPMLDDMTPRQCAANPDTREKAINWLKNLEMHNLKTGELFDTTWMWEELSLSDYR